MEKLGLQRLTIGRQIPSNRSTGIGQSVLRYFSTGTLIDGPQEDSKLLICAIYWEAFPNSELDFLYPLPWASNSCMVFTAWEPPINRDIEMLALPRNFRVPEIKKFKGKDDPVRYLQHFCTLFWG